MLHAMNNTIDDLKPAPLSLRGMNSRLPSCNAPRQLSVLHAVDNLVDDMKGASLIICRVHQYYRPPPRHASSELTMLHVINNTANNMKRAPLLLRGVNSRLPPRHAPCQLTVLHALDHSIDNVHTTSLLRYFVLAHVRGCSPSPHAPRKLAVLQVSYYGFHQGDAVAVAMVLVNVRGTALFPRVVRL